MKTYRIGLFGAGGKLAIDDTFLSYRNPYAHTFRVPIKDIQTVTVDDIGRGKAMLKIVGHGAELAKVQMPFPWANKCQEWILREMKV